MSKALRTKGLNVGERDEFDSCDGFEQALLITFNCKILHLIVHCKINSYDSLKLYTSCAEIFCPSFVFNESLGRAVFSILDGTSVKLKSLLQEKRTKFLCHRYDRSIRLYYTDTFLFRAKICSFQDLTDLENDIIEFRC